MLVALVPAQAGRLESRVKRLMANSPVAREGFAGILVVDEKGHKLVSINAEHAFIPASNTKLFSIALALERLGPDKRFETRVEQRGNDLVLIGSGDANLSGRVLPYRHNSESGPPLTVMDDLAAQIAAHGIQEVRGDIIGDDTAFLYEPFARGWAAEDLVEDDGAPVSALVVNDNVIDVRVIAGAQGAVSAQVLLDPPFPLFGLDNRAVTGAADELHTERIPETGTWRLWGSIAAGSPQHVEQWAVADPAQFAALALKYSLERHGVRVSGSGRALHRLPGAVFTPSPTGVTVAAHTSEPLVEDLRLTAKISQNLHADLLLSDVGGSREDGLKELAAFLAAMGIPPNQFRFYDGSGLSRLNLVTPTAVITLLRFMAASAHREDWMTLLPVSGVDGSLATRLTGPRVKGRIRAKTGSLNHVSALAGYAQTRKGDRLTFSIFVNNSTAGVAEQRELIDKICAVFVE